MEPTNKYCYYMVYLIKNKRFIFLGKKIVKDGKPYDIKQIIPECSKGLARGGDRGSFVFNPNIHKMVIQTSRINNKLYDDYIEL